MCLFHFTLDVHHKLIRLKIVTLAGIEGFSMLIVYMKCSDNNRSSTVYNLFWTLSEGLGFPLVSGQIR